MQINPVVQGNKGSQEVNQNSRNNLPSVSGKNIKNTLSIHENSIDHQNINETSRITRNLNLSPIKQSYNPIGNTNNDAFNIQNQSRLANNNEE